MAMFFPQLKSTPSLRLQNTGRIMRALFEITLRRGWPKIAARLLTLCKTVDQRLWAFEHPLKQFGRLSQDVLRKIDESKLTMDRLRDMRANDIGELGVMYLLD